MVLAKRLPSRPPRSTWFAPAQRAPHRTLQMEAEACLANPVAQFLTASLDGLVLILDCHRQVLAANASVQALVGATSEALMGRRPGEVFGCIHAEEGPGGCGTSRACAHCGAVLAILEGQRTGRPARSECLLMLRNGDTTQCAEFEIAVNPLRVGRHEFQAVFLHDVSPTKRRDALERLFFHDIANLMQGIRGWSDLLCAGGASTQQVADKLVRLTGLLDRELQSYRAMVQAEHGELRPNLREVPPIEILQDVRDLLSRHATGGSRPVVLRAISAEPIRTDPELLSRVMLNLAVNAAEAIAPGESVTLSVRPVNGQLRFQVHNPGEIPQAIRSQIFLRSFSTKADSGRGLGTYAVKLFGEKVLGGKVGFDTGPPGTTFWIDLDLFPA
ncbi:PAS domain-containing sensor histidine kinase [Geothrix campi]|uniref:sensor histidine kinase n=1 Tax=Geothrix campi TaxID=2966450 RepID=UPI002148E85F|nr:PAS domain-containing sensor histidine kinase [Geothrix sp. SG10]